MLQHGVWSEDKNWAARNSLQHAHGLQDEALFVSCPAPPEKRIPQLFRIPFTPVATCSPNVWHLPTAPCEEWIADSSSPFCTSLVYVTNLFSRCSAALLWALGCFGHFWTGGRRGSPWEKAPSWNLTFGGFHQENQQLYEMGMARLKDDLLVRETIISTVLKPEDSWVFYLYECGSWHSMNTWEKNGPFEDVHDRC